MNKKERAQKNREYIEKMTSSLSGITEGLGSAKDSAQEVINFNLTPEIEAQMTPEQLEILNISRGAFSLDGVEILEKLQNLTKTLRSHADNS